MTKLIITISLFLLLGCRDNNSTQSFSKVDKKDINEIVKAIVNQNNLPFHKTNKPETIPLSINLRKLRVTVPDTTTEVPPPVDHNTVSIFKLFNSLVEHQRFFARIDSSFFLFQNTSVDSFIIDKTMTEKLVTTTFYEQQQKAASNLTLRYYDLTIPILSADQRKAYIELTNNCSGCGGATAFFLEKTNSKWIIAGWRSLWRE
jgi:hypothetical protein